MSYGLDFAPDAESQWRDLPPEVQESVLDELDRLADNPPPPPTAEVVRDFVYAAGGTDHYVFLRCVIDRRRRNIVLTGVVTYTRPNNP